ncbi:alpha/beta-hydrolase [Xylariaceae sp. FL0804]|nr:alpha/beta-hydrolase [Xylariaceae sp. FL0804]
MWSLLFFVMLQVFCNLIYLPDLSSSLPAIISPLLFDQLPAFPLAGLPIFISFAHLTLPFSSKSSQRLPSYWILDPSEMGIGKWLVIALLGLLMDTTLATSPLVKVQHSKVTYRGMIKDNVEDFHQIKFAQDTSGLRRFAPPEAYIPPEGSEIDATQPGPACPQLRAAAPPFFADTPEQSEDCLHLRVTRPTGTGANNKLPVVIHVLGGGVVKADAEDGHFDPSNLITHSVSLQKPIIHVVFNYRVTIFGFARLPPLADQKSLNVGVRDQRAAFQWVKDNIKAFGGDPDRITVFGLSSGGTLSCLHAMAYGGEEGVPFNQIWAMSGPPGSALNMTSDATEIHTRNVADKLGCTKQDDDALLECLRDIPMDTLTETAMDYSMGNHPPMGLYTFIPSVDGDFFPERQSVLYKAGRFVRGIPMVFGWTHDDGAMNAGPAPAFQTEEDMKTPLKEFAHALTDNDYEHLFALYPASDFEQDVRNYDARKQDSDPEVSVHFFRIARILRDLMFACSSVDFGYETWKQSRNLDSNFPGVWHYDLNQSTVTPMFHAAGMPWLGAVHGSDMDYIYNNMVPKDQLAEGDREVSSMLATSFVEFAYSGHPRGQDGKLWPESFAELRALGEETSDGTSPSGMNLQLIGGPFGTGSSYLERAIGASIDTSADEGVMQSPLDHSRGFGEMGSAGSQQRHELLQRERLLERCTFIDSLAEKLGH